MNLITALIVDLMPDLHFNWFHQNSFGLKPRALARLVLRLHVQL
jgi:hypothetical protein